MLVNTDTVPREVIICAVYHPPLVICEQYAHPLRHDEVAALDQPQRLIPEVSGWYSRIIAVWLPMALLIAPPHAASEAPSSVPLTH
jgi:hypothetical protein